MGSPTRLRQNDAPTMSNIMHGASIRSLVRIGNVPIVMVQPLKFIPVYTPRSGGDARVVGQ